MFPLPPEIVENAEDMLAGDSTLCEVPFSMLTKQALVTELGQFVKN